MSKYTLQRSILRVAALTIAMFMAVAASAVAQNTRNVPRSPAESHRQFRNQTREERDLLRHESQIARRNYLEAIRPYEEYRRQRSAELNRQLRSAAPHERGQIQNQLLDLMRWYMDQTEAALTRYLNHTSTATRRYLDETQPARDAWFRDAQARYDEMLRDFRARYGSSTYEFPEREEVYSTLLELAGRRSNDLVPDHVLSVIYDAYRAGPNLTWNDIQQFQSDLMRSTAYRHEPRALAPNEFYTTGGGNCVDYSVATASFLRHHGISAYVGSFISPGARVGHAVVLVPVRDVPPGYVYIEIENWSTIDGRRIPDGTYVPVDYEFVGGFSSATAPNAVLTRLFRPEQLVGRYW